MGTDVRATTEGTAMTRARVSRELITIWASLFGDDGAHIADDDDFFVLGGTSLLALRLIESIASRFHVELSILDLLDNSRLGALAQRVVESHAVSDDAPHGEGASR